MNEPPAGPDNRQAIDDQAAAFVARLQGEIDETERQSLYAWVAADPRHAVAFARMEAAWEAGARLRACAPAIEDVPANQDAPTPWVSRRALVGGFVGVTALAGVATAAWRYTRDVELYRTRLGERCVVTLSDGSRVHLNTASTIEVAMEKRRRRIHLVKGEALFEVAHDTARPFLVDAGSARLRAVGTAFNVRIRESLVELTVTEGIVAVAPNGNLAHAPATPHIVAGDGAVIRSGAVAPTVLNPDLLRQRTAWQDGVIELDGETLSQAVEEFNRYRGHPIVVGDPRLANLRVGGRFEVDEADKFLTALEGSFPVSAITAADGSILLVMRA